MTSAETGEWGSRPGWYFSFPSADPAQGQKIGGTPAPLFVFQEESGWRKLRP
jgi:hypothetical protein